MTIMSNLERLKLETKGINLSDDELSIYLMEADLTPYSTYEPSSRVAKRNIYKAALSILESIANQPANMKNYKEDDISVSQFAENLQDRIEQLERKIRTMQTDDDKDSDSSFFLFYNR